MEFAGNMFLLEQQLGQCRCSVFVERAMADVFLSMRVRSIKRWRWRGRKLGVGVVVEVCVWGGGGSKRLLQEEKTGVVMRERERDGKEEGERKGSSVCCLL